MRFGLSLPHYGFSLPGAEPITFAAMTAWGRRAEALGFDSVWVSDHLFYSFRRYGGDPGPIASLEPMTALAGLAAVTDRVRLGTLVLCTPFRHPVLTGKMATTIDGISGGRFDLGLGAGWLEDEFTAFAYPYGTTGERFAVLEETLEVLDVLRSGESATYDGPTVHLRNAALLPAPVQHRLPVWVGGKGGPRLLGVAARLADGWNAAWRWTPEAYGARAAAARAACERLGRDPASFGLSLGLYSLTGDTEVHARRAFEHGRAAMPGDAMRDETYDTWRADTLSGTPDQVLERIRDFEALGVSEIVLAPWVLPFAIHDPEQVERFAEHVIRPLRT